MRLRQPNQQERIWLRETLIAHGDDLFSAPEFHLDQYQLNKRRKIYPPDNCSLNHHRVALIKKLGKPDPSIWARRLDLFLISVELPDGDEKIYTLNLAGLGRDFMLRAQSAIAETLPEGATVEGQTIWTIAYEVACQLLYLHDAEFVWVSQFLQNLVTDELDIETPIRANEPLFTKENMQAGLAEKKWHPFTPLQWRALKREVLLKEHDSAIDLNLNPYGFLENQS